MSAPPERRQTLDWLVFGLMSSVTFVGILSELLPSGVLPQMSEGMGRPNPRSASWSVSTR